MTNEKYVDGDPEWKIYLNNLETHYNNDIRMKKLNKIDGCS
jgi:hypothetical protein